MLKILSSVSLAALVLGGCKQAGAGAGAGSGGQGSSIASESGFSVDDIETVELFQDRRLEKRQWLRVKKTTGGLVQVVCSVNQPRNEDFKKFGIEKFDAYETIVYHCGVNLQGAYFDGARPSAFMVARVGVQEVPLNCKRNASGITCEEKADDGTPSLIRHSLNVGISGSDVAVEAVMNYSNGELQDTLELSSFYQCRAQTIEHMGGMVDCTTPMFEAAVLAKKDETKPSGSTLIFGTGTTNMKCSFMGVSPNNEKPIVVCVK